MGHGSAPKRPQQRTEVAGSRGHQLGRPDRLPAGIQSTIAPTNTTVAVSAVFSAALAQYAAIAAAASQQLLIRGRRAHSPRLPAPPPRHRGHAGHSHCPLRSAMRRGTWNVSVVIPAQIVHAWYWNRYRERYRHRYRCRHRYRDWYPHRRCWFIRYPVLTGSGSQDRKHEC